MTITINKDGSIISTRVTYNQNTHEIVCGKYRTNYQGIVPLDTEDVVSNTAVYAVLQWMIGEAKQHSSDCFALSWPFEDYEMIVRRKEKK